jgi:hypothetical protein
MLSWAVPNGQLRCSICTVALPHMLFDGGCIGVSHDVLLQGRASCVHRASPEGDICPDVHHLCLAGYAALPC